MLEVFSQNEHLATHSKELYSDVRNLPDWIDAYVVECFENSVLIQLGLDDKGAFLDLF